MRSMTLDELRAASDAGGVESVTLKGQGGSFLVRIATLGGADALLATARDHEPRRFVDPGAALNVLRDVGITVGLFDASEWDPADGAKTVGNRGEPDAIETARGAAYTDWLAAEIQASLDDPRPNLSHDDVMADMDVEIASATAER